jgi:hypothetical protein
MTFNTDLNCYCQFSFMWVHEGRHNIWWGFGWGLQAHPDSKAAVLNLNRWRVTGPGVGLVWHCLQQYSVSPWLSTTHTLIPQHREHTGEQSWAVRWQFIADTVPVFSTWLISHFPLSLATVGVVIYFLTSAEERENRKMYTVLLVWAAVGVMAIAESPSLKIVTEALIVRSLHVASKPHSSIS